MQKMPVEVEDRVMSANDEPIPKLMNCDACGERIATAAVVCPKCGAPNKWVHPEIERFRQAFRSSRPFTYTWDKFAVHGSAEVKRGGRVLADYAFKAMVAVGFCFVLFLILDESVLSLRRRLDPLIWTSVFVGVGSLILLSVGLMKQKATDSNITFTIDFSKTPPAWRSVDEDFWCEVKQFWLSGDKSEKAEASL